MAVPSGVVRPYIMAQHQSFESFNLTELGLTVASRPPMAMPSKTWFTDQRHNLALTVLQIHQWKTIAINRAVNSSSVVRASDSPMKML